MSEIKPIKSLESEVKEGDLTKLNFEEGGYFLGTYLGRATPGINHFLFVSPFCGIEDNNSYHHLSPNSWKFMSGPYEAVESYEILGSSD